MNETKTKPPTGEGWAVHVYDSDRHLRLTVEPSHIWAFGWGTGVGIFVTVALSTFYSASSNTKHLINPSLNPETTSEEGSHAEPTSSFPLGID